MWQPYKELLKHLGIRHERDALQPFLPRFSKEPDGSEKATGKPLRIDNENTLRALRGSGIECPQLSAELFRIYVESLIARGFLEAPGR